MNLYTPPVRCTTPPRTDGGERVLHPTRQRALDIARAYVGRIGDRGGERFGRALLEDVHNCAYGADTTKWDGWSQALANFGGHPVQWSGVFVAAVLRKAGRRGVSFGRWDSKTARRRTTVRGLWEGPIHVSRDRTDAATGDRRADGWAPADVVVLKKPSRKPVGRSHPATQKWALIESVSADGEWLTTIEADTRVRSRPAPDVAAAAAAAGIKPDPSALRVANSVVRRRRARTEVDRWYRSQRAVWVVEEGDGTGDYCPYPDLWDPFDQAAVPPSFEHALPDDEAGDDGDLFT